MFQKNDNLITTNLDLASYTIPALHEVGGSLCNSLSSLRILLEAIIDLLTKFLMEEP